MLEFPIPALALLDRDNYMVERCRQKTVLHLGCADAPYTVESIRSGALLHLKLASVAREILGVDLNADAVELLHGLGVKSVTVGNAERLDQLEGERLYDMIVAGEILEHLPNPGLCLTGARSILAPGGMILVSVPNAFCLKSLLRVGLRSELVHADHVCYYSAATLTRLAEHAGLKCDIVGFYSSRPKNYMKRALEIVFFGWSRIVAPQWAEGLVAVLRPYDDRDRTPE